MRKHQSMKAIGYLLNKTNFKYSVDTEKRTLTVQTSPEVVIEFAEDFEKIDAIYYNGILVKTIYRNEKAFCKYSVEIGKQYLKDWSYIRVFIENVDIFKLMDV